MYSALLMVKNKPGPPILLSVIFLSRFIWFSAATNKHSDSLEMILIIYQ